MSQIGVWIDKREAKIVSINNKGEETIQTIISNVESFNPTGGSGTRMKGGSQDVIQDNKYLEREKHQLTTFFKDISEYILGSNSIMIFGLAETGTKLNTELAKQFPQLYSNVKSVQRADSMTDKQILAWVRAYYTANV